MSNVIEAIGRAQRALNGESNDEEHDALFELVEALGGPVMAENQKREEEARRVRRLEPIK